MEKGTQRWRIFLLVLGLALAGLDLWALAHWERSLVVAQSGTHGGALGARGRDLSYEVIAAPAGSALAAAGVKPGNRILFDRLGDSRRALGVGERIAASVQDEAGSRAVTLQTVAVDSIGWGARIGYAGLALAVLVSWTVGMLVGWRRGGNRSTRAFALCLLTVSANFVVFSLPGGAVQDALYRVALALYFFPAYFLFTYFAFTFPDGEPSPGRRRWRPVVIGHGVVAVVLAAIASLNTLGWTQGIRLLPSTGQLFAVASVVLSYTFLTLAWKDTTGSARQRLAWIGISMGSIYATYLLINLDAVLGMPVPMEAMEAVQGVVMIVGYVGLGYALLRHRVFDVGFAVNRALVYGFVSVILLVSFGLLEWVAHKLIHFESQQNNALLDAGIAIVVFLGFHKIRDHVEQAIERMFFHAWHAKEAALRRFVKLAAHVTSSEVLVENTREALSRFSGGARAAIYLRQPDGGYALRAGEGARAAVDANDAIAVALRADAAPAFLEGEGAYELAVPMTHRGVLNGFVLLGAKTGGESYRPDELEVLGYAVHQVGLDLHSIEVERLRDELARVTTEAATLRSVLTSPGAPASAE